MKITKLELQELIRRIVRESIQANYNGKPRPMGMPFTLTPKDQQKYGSRLAMFKIDTRSGKPHLVVLGKEKGRGGSLIRRTILQPV